MNTTTPATKPAKKAATKAATKAPKKAAETAPKGPGRDPGSMLNRMKQRLCVEEQRLVNTQTRALQHGDKAGAKKAGTLASDLRKVIAKFD